jgi:hypothetical protein
MSATINIIETTTELGIEVVEVVVASASTPGPAGAGVPTGGTDGQVLTKTSGTDYATAWEDPTGAGGGAPDDVDYLVGTASGDLSAEIVVGTSPGGELGGTWASPTVDATHSGSSHAAVQAAAEATAASALSAHSSDTTSVHGIADTSALALTANVQPLDSDLTAIAALTTTSFGRGLLELANQAALLSAAGAAAASHAHAGEDITSGTVADARIASTIARDSEVTAAIAALSTVYQPLDSDLTAIAALTTTSFGRAFLAFADEAAFKAGVNLEAGTDFPSLSTFNDHSARHENGGADEISLAGLDGTPSALQTHLDDTSDAHDASAISVADVAGDYTATDVEGVLAEIAPQLGGASNLADLDDVTGTPDTGEAPVWDGDSFELTNVATQAELDAHTGDTSDAHDASAISVADAGAIFTGADVEAVLAELYGKLPRELDYAQITSSVGCTATSEATANSIVTGNAVTYDGSTVILIEFYMPLWTHSANNNCYLVLYDGSSSIGKVGQLFQTANSGINPIRVARRLTPSAASHTYSIRGYTDTGGTFTAFAGAGGSGNLMPAFIRITKVVA